MKYRHIFLLFSLLFKLSTTFSQTPTSTQPSGTGTVNDPYLISSLANLYFLSQNPSYYASGKFIKQTANIDASETSSWFSDGSGGYYGFPIIGGDSRSVGNHVYGTFAATYDGQGYNIRNLYIRRGCHYVALFGHCFGATIKNLNLINPNVNVTNTSCGSANYQGNAIFIAAFGNTTIQNIRITNGILQGNSAYGYFGGILGRGGTVTATDCTVEATINLSSSSAGKGGGFLGYSASGTASMTNCFTKGSITSNQSYIGGFLGSIALGSNNSFTKCGSQMNVNALQYAGGFAGEVYDNNSTFTDCYSTGNVTANYSGGFYAYSSYFGSTFSRCYSSGIVSGTNSGGFGYSGYSYNTHIFSNCFWDNQNSTITSPFGTSSFAATGLTGKTTTQMQDISTFTDASWNFTTIWNIQNGTNGNYPFIRNNGSTLPVTWLFFTAEKQAAGALLKWSTASEQNTKDFEVQHSTNTLSWTPLGTVTAAGNSTTIQQYSFTHATPFKGNVYNYYRILQRDLDGKFSYSKIASLIYDEPGPDVFVYPNPATGAVTIYISESKDVRLINVAGATVWKGTLSAGRNQIPLTHLAKGVYWVVTENYKKQLLIQ